MEGRRDGEIFNSPSHFLSVPPSLHLSTSPSNLFVTTRHCLPYSALLHFPGGLYSRAEFRTNKLNIHEGHLCERLRLAGG